VKVSKCVPSFTEFLFILTRSIVVVGEFHQWPSVGPRGHRLRVGRPPGALSPAARFFLFFFLFLFFLLKKPKSKSKKKRENLFLPFLFFCLTALQPPATVQFTAERRTGRTRSRGRAVLLLFRLLLLLLLLLSACACVCVGLARSTVTSSWRERITSSAVRFWISFKEKQTNSWTAASVCA